MKTFPHWRAVGRAMRWARQQDGVRQERERGPVARQHRWTSPGDDGAIVGITWGGGMGLDVDTYTTGGMAGELADVDNAGHALRVLAALDLIPAHLAYGEDERFGRCQRCGRIAQWVPPTGTFAPRWCHLDPTRPYHVPEVTG